MTMNDFQDDSKWGKELLRCTSTVSHLVTNWRFFAMQCKCIKSIQLQIFWWKRIRKASEHKQMKRNNEIDLFFCSCYCIASFYFSWFTQHYRPKKEGKKPNWKKICSQPMRYTIIENNQLLWIFLSISSSLILEFRRHSSFGCNSFWPEHFSNELSITWIQGKKSIWTWNASNVSCRKQATN